MDHVLKGLYVPLVTPFTADGQIALEALEALAHAVLEAGASGVVALGTTGEPATLGAAEQRSVLDVCARVCRERSATLIAGAGSNDTAGSAEALRELGKRPEISAALTVVPYFTRPSQEGVIAHFTRLAEVSPVPLVIYNIPHRTGQHVGWQALRRLADLPGIAGVKQAVGGIDDDTIRLMASAGLPDGFAVLAGDDVFAAPLLALGAAGAILASAHVRTGDFVAMVSAWRAGGDGHAEQYRGARALSNQLIPLSAALFAEPNPTVIKGVLYAQGRIPSAAVRLPLLPAAPASVDAAVQLATPGAGGMVFRQPAVMR
jgi:4-hydroxy-tetrahydrodipicolinate synthase